MSKSRKSSNNNNSKKKGKKPLGKKHATKKASPKEIVFDPEARTAYLQGFSERKKQRRLYGLAMQKVKDRKEKLERRANNRQAVEDQVKELEQQKLMIMQQKAREARENKPTHKTTTSTAIKNEPLDHVETYQDEQTLSQWGGNVIVQVSEYISSDEDESTIERKKTGVDRAQEYAGNVEKYIKVLKGKAPKKSNHSVKRKGQHGASQMKGMGNLKTAKKMLAQSESKVATKKGKHKR
jgi:Nucleolar protein 12 (25kDa)